MKNQIPKEVRLVSQTEMSSLVLIYEGSTLLERPGTYGLSHLMEHLMCKAYEHLQDDFQKYSIEWNAYTTSDYVVFYWTGLREYLLPQIPVLLKLLNKLPFNTEQLELEKQTVLQEYHKVFSKQSPLLNLFRREWGYYMPIGLEQDITNITYEDCQWFYNNMYCCPDAILLIDKSPDDTQLEYNFPQKITREWEWKTQATPDAPQEKGSLNDNMKNIIVYGLIEGDVKKAYMIEMASKILCGGLNSPVFKEIRERLGLTYSIGMYLQKIGDKWVWCCTCECTPKNVQIILDKLSQIILDDNSWLEERYTICKTQDEIAIKIAACSRHQYYDDLLDPVIAFSLQKPEITLAEIKEEFLNFWKTAKTHVE